MGRKTHNEKRGEILEVFVKPQEKRYWKDHRIYQTEFAFSSILMGSEKGLPRTFTHVVINHQALGSWQIRFGVSKHVILFQLLWKHRPVEGQTGSMAHYVTIFATMPDDLSLNPGPTWWQEA